MEERGSAHLGLEARRLVELVLCENLRKPLHECLVCRLWECTLLVEDHEDAPGPVLDQIQHFGVVLVADIGALKGRQV